MTSAEIRQSYLDYFARQGHTIVPSSPLLPSSPNLLFTNAGMNQFVPYFLGERPAPYGRAADTQKCIRAGGKHNDLEDVGFDTYHHTFFEMLGNWSFGNYFKKEAIQWAWELLTVVWGFPKERLYATVYQPGPNDPAEYDAEAASYWAELFRAAGLDPAVHVRTGGKKDNFWMMGETGPCGPCSEVHVDLTPLGDTRGQLVNTGDVRCLEIWNLVFIQYNAQPDGTFRPLPARHVDTGMGFERVAGILATTNNFSDFSATPSNYNSDVFAPYFARLTARTGHIYGRTLPAVREKMSEQEAKDCAYRVLADHARTLTCAIADGILPGNEGRHYVLRRILRRGVLWGRRLGLTSGAISGLVPAVVETLGGVFPELCERETVVTKVIANEEAAFERTIERGLRLIEDLLARGATAINGPTAFELYDTYGFPLDLTELVARERGLAVDAAGFEVEMERQRTRSREHQKKTVITVAEGADAAGATAFVGYEADHLTACPATLRAVLTQNGATFLDFDRTPFYAEKGGQVADTGTVELAGLGSLNVVQVVEDAAGRRLHQVEGSVAESAIGASALLTVNGPRRRAIERHHTATHILHWALREVLGTHTRQAGSYVDDQRLRFDYAHFEAPSKEQLARIEALANQRLLANAPVRWFETAFDQKPANCLAFFGEKYGAQVRVVDIGGWSVELCAGTHVRSTGELGLIKITVETSIKAGTRRLEAVAGEAAYALLAGEYDLVRGLAQRLSCRPDELDSRLTGLLDTRAELEREVKRLRAKELNILAGELAATATAARGLKWVAASLPGATGDEARAVAKQIASLLGPSVVVIGVASGEKSTVTALCSPEAVAAKLSAGAIVGELAGALGGKGGGKPDFATGGGKDAARLPEVLAAWLAKATAA